MNDSNVLGECPPENVFVQMLQDRLDEEARHQLDAHLDRCPICAQLVLELADLISHYSEEREGSAAQDVVRGGEGGEHAPGIFLDGYRLEEMIGAGGMGVVFRARDLTLERDVAIKVIRADLLARASLQGTTPPGKRLLQEARMLARVEHPNVVSIYAASFAGEHLYIVMELVEGETLDGYIRHHASTRVAILDLYIQVCEGLEAAHARGVIHRDVKPSNILVNAEGCALLTDFGLARAVIEQERSGEGGEAGAQSSLTRRGVVLGTPAFMPPEQHLGGVADERSDVFACCASIFWSLFGARPFEGSTIEEVALNACAGEVRSVALETRALQALHATLIKGMARKKSARHASIVELAEELREARASLAREGGEGAPTSSRGYLSLRYLVLGAALLTLAVVSAAWLLRTPEPAQRERLPSGAVATSREEPQQADVSPTADVSRGVEVALLQATADVARATTAGEQAQPARAPAPSPVRSASGGGRLAASAARKAPRATSTAPQEVAGDGADEVEMGRRLIAAQVVVARSMERHDARACHEALEGSPAQNVTARLLKGQCLLLDGECEASDELFREAYREIAPGMDISGLLELNRKSCKPPESAPEELLAWRSQVLFYKDVALCKEVARQVVQALDRGDLSLGDRAKEDARLTLRNNLGYGLRCLARSKDPASLCDLVEKMAYHVARLTGISDEEVAMRAAMDELREVPELTMCVR